PLSCTSTVFLHDALPISLPSQALWQILSRSSDLPVRERSNRRVLAIACCVLRIVGPPPRQGKSGTECSRQSRGPSGWNAPSPGEDRKSTRLNSSHVAISY